MTLDIVLITVTVHISAKRSNVLKKSVNVKMTSANLPPDLISFIVNVLYWLTVTYIFLYNVFLKTLRPPPSLSHFFIIIGFLNV